MFFHHNFGMHIFLKKVNLMLGKIKVSFGKTSIKFQSSKYTVGTFKTMKILFPMSKPI